MDGGHRENGRKEGVEWTDETCVQAGFLVSRKTSGLLIGKGGANVKKLKAESQLRHINFDKNTLPGPGELQLMVMMGTPTQIQFACEKACDMIVTELESKGDDSSGKVELRVLVQEDQVSMVIGKGGKKIKADQSSTRTKMSFSDQGMYGEAILTIKGKPDGVSKALEKVMLGLPVEAWQPGGDRPLFRAAYGKGLPGPQERRGPPPRGFDDYGPPRGGPYDDYGPPPRGGRGHYDDYGPPPRGYDDYGPPRGYDERGPAKRHKTFGVPVSDSGLMDDTIVRAGFVVSKIYAGHLIGKRGNTVKRVTQESGCSNISFGDGCVTGTELHLIVLRGNVEGINSAMVRICDLMQHYAKSRKAEGHAVSTLPDGVAELRMLVPDGQVAKLIGKKGAMIKSIEASTRCKLKFGRDEKADKIDGDWLCTMTGNPTAIGDAIRTVLGLLDLDSFTVERTAFTGVGMGKEEELWSTRGKGPQKGPGGPGPRGPGPMGGGPPPMGRGPPRDYYDAPPPRDYYADYDYYPPPAREAYGAPPPQEAYAAPPPAAAAAPDYREMDAMVATQRKLELALETHKQRMGSRLPARGAQMAPAPFGAGAKRPREW